MAEGTLQAIAFDAKSLTHPFPYDDCRYVLRLFPEASALIPDLDLYFGTIAGYAIGATQIARFSLERLATAANDLASSFFEQHPEYELLQREITAVNTPALHEQFLRIEELRGRLRVAIQQLRSPDFNIEPQHRR